METMYVSLSLCDRNPPVTCGLLNGVLSMRWLNVFFDFSLNKLLYKQSICRSFETPWNTCDVTVIWNANTDADSESVHNDRSLTLCRKLFKMLTCFNVNGFCSGCSGKSNDLPIFSTVKSVEKIFYQPNSSGTTLHLCDNILINHKNIWSIINTYETETRQNKVW